MSYYLPETYKACSSVGYLIRRAKNLMMGCVEAAFVPYDITFAQWTVLMCLRDGIANTAAEICREMCHDSGALTRILDQLGQRGYIERHRSLEDRRMVTLHLTEAGREAVESLIPVVTDLLNKALAGFTREEADSFTHFLNKFIQTIQASSEQRDAADRLEPAHD